MKKWFVLLGSLVLILGLLAGCGGKTESTNSSSGSGAQSSSNTAAPESTSSSSSSAADESVWKGKVLTVLTGGTSGVYFPLGTTLAKVYSEQLGANATAQTTGASAENAAKISQKKAEVGFALADTVADAYQGIGKFEKSGALSNLRGITALYSNYMQLVTTKDSGITKLEDLKGKRVVVGAAGSGTEIMANRILKAAGISYDDINEDFLSFSEGIDGIKNGTVDAAFISSGLPNSGIMELATTKDVNLVPIPQEIVDILKKDYPAFTLDVIPAGTYKGLDQDIPSAVIKNILITYEELDEQAVYELTKTFFENLQALMDTHNAAKAIKLEKGPDGLPLPLHPGAEKYFKEKGVLK
ncbi:TAXI family TRAP transporter solute-binding subunit [Microaerobacter geothermalis]|uniref:TAXI family TRAP transporter solute-binding subunit n=1 Tax=Microaerobacter geothermalis TaxID=674972 RepID=UPI001F1EDAD0|nr:TAXI family TRAP transporter solute-binding subunit [Microaerobacter geothermalis]MCF6094585.1 TAXI family TRAP transporter solute-binding subunit [Microaerobacter geothermalis]